MLETLEKLIETPIPAVAGFQSDSSGTIALEV
jgi:hypothetical protein